MAAVQQMFGHAAGAWAVVWVGAAAGMPASADGCVEAVDDCPNPLTPDGGDLPVSAIVVGAVFLGVFVFGLRAIKRQRDQGRRSKLPPIG